MEENDDYNTQTRRKFQLHSINILELGAKNKTKQNKNKNKQTNVAKWQPLTPKTLTAYPLLFAKITGKDEPTFSYNHLKAESSVWVG